VITAKSTIPNSNADHRAQFPGEDQRHIGNSAITSSIEEEVGR